MRLLRRTMKALGRSFRHGAVPPKGRTSRQELLEQVRRGLKTGR